jgi:alkylhydroperoxidase family enzyme
MAVAPALTLAHATPRRQANLTSAFSQWRRDAPYFTDAEREALALTEAVTRLSDRADPGRPAPNRA